MVLRKEAIKIIIENDISKLTRDELLSSDVPTNDVMDFRYNELLHIAAEGRFYGIPNEYLSELVSKIVGSNIKVEGYVEKLLPCPCCNYETLAQRGEYDICPVCFWEDDGNNDPNRYSGPNHMTLSEGRSNYEKYGACSKEEAKFVTSNRYEIYNKAD